MKHPHRSAPGHDDWRRNPLSVPGRFQGPLTLEGEVRVIPRSRPLIRTPWLFLLVFLLVVLTSIFLAWRLGHRHSAEAKVYIQLSSEATAESQAVGDASLRREMDMLQGSVLHMKTLDRIGIETLYPDIGAGLKGEALPFWVELSHGLKVRLFRSSRHVSLAEERRQWLLDSALRRFRGALRIRGEGGSSFITLGFRHTDRRMAIAALSEFLKVYQESRQGLYPLRQTRPLRLKLEIQRSRLRAFDSLIARFVRKSSLQNRMEAAAHTPRGDELANKIRETRQALTRLETKLENLRRSHQTTHPPAPLNPAVLAGMRETLMKLEGTREHIRALPYSSRRDLVEIEDKIKSLKAFLYQRQAASTKTESMEVEIQRLQREITALRSQLETLNQQRDSESVRLQQLEIAALWQPLEDMQKGQNGPEFPLALTAQQARKLETLRRSREKVSQAHSATLASWKEIEQVNRARQQMLGTVRVLQPSEYAGPETRWSILLALLSLPLGLLLAIGVDRLPWRR